MRFWDARQQPYGPSRTQAILRTTILPQTSSNRPFSPVWTTFSANPSTLPCRPPCRVTTRTRTVTVWASTSAVDCPPDTVATAAAWLSPPCAPAARQTARRGPDRSTMAGTAPPTSILPKTHPSFWSGTWGTAPMEAGITPAAAPVATCPSAVGTIWLLRPSICLVVMSRAGQLFGVRPSSARPTTPSTVLSAIPRLGVGLSARTPPLRQDSRG